MRLFSIIGAGVLVGAALCVIIPEGVNEIYETNTRRELLEAMSRNVNSTNKQTHRGIDSHTIVGFTLLLGFVMMLVIDHISSNYSNSHNYSSLPTHHGDNTSVPSQNNESSSEQRVSHSRHRSSTSVASIGLIIHSAGL